MISPAQFKSSAAALNVDVASIKAVAEVESMGDGFLPNGKPKILFEPHIFWKELVKRGINPANHVKGNEDILYQKWGAKPYGKYSEQHGRLERARAINRDAALSSASWGKFQIMGFNWKLCKCESLDEFVNAMTMSEDEHLKLFANFLLTTDLDEALKQKNWAAFARGYNGTGFAANNYDKKLKKAYEKFKAEPVL
jgi:hypothetical protein